LRIVLTAPGPAADRPLRAALAGGVRSALERARRHAVEDAQIFAVIYHPAIPPSARSP